MREWQAGVGQEFELLDSGAALSLVEVKPLEITVPVY